MKLLSRDLLTDEQWAVLRDAPQLVIRAISASGGSRWTHCSNARSGTRAIEDGRNNDHPLIRALALPGEIDAAVSNVAAEDADWDTAVDGPEALVQRATAAVAQAAEVLRSVGGELDRYAYREFILGAAREVAEAAREVTSSAWAATASVMRARGDRLPVAGIVFLGAACSRPGTNASATGCRRTGRRRSRFSSETSSTKCAPATESYVIQEQ